MAAKKDLFKHVEELPPAVQALLVDYSLLDSMDSQLHIRMANELKAHGYTFDKDDNNDPINLRPIEPVTQYVYVKKPLMRGAFLL